MEIKNKKILVLAPHTDDMEFGCGGTIAKLVKENEVYCVAFSACKQSVLVGFEEDVLIKEFKIASQIIGLKKENLILHDYEVRTFHQYRQEILDILIALRKELDPDIIFCPSLNDIHQDHAVVAVEALRAFKTKTIFGYELIWNNLTFNSTCFFELSQSEMATKVEALKAYKSQAHRDYAKEDFIVSWAKTRGMQIGKELAECFEVVRINL